MESTSSQRVVVSRGSSILNVILIIVIVLLFILLVLTGYYLISSCDEGSKKSFMSYLFDLEFSPCENGMNSTPFSQDISDSIDHTKRELIRESEVFHISDQIYPYDQAACKCSAYGAELATESQVIDAYNQGASWDNYGWTKGKKAFYPIQSHQYYKCLKKTDKKDWHKCRKAGVIGGNFKDTVKFGVNCYGIKPEGHISIPKKQGKPTEAEVCEVVGNHESNNQLKTDEVAPFNRDQWSVYN